MAGNEVAISDRCRKKPNCGLKDTNILWSRGKLLTVHIICRDCDELTISLNTKSFDNKFI